MERNELNAYCHVCSGVLSSTDSFCPGCGAEVPALPVPAGRRVSLSERPPRVLPVAPASPQARERPRRARPTARPDLTTGVVTGAVALDHRSPKGFVLALVLGRRRHEKRCEVRRFRLTDKHGAVVECVATGALDGIDLRPGDHLEVRGKRNRRGILVVRRILVTVTGIGATPRPGNIFLLARIADILAVVLLTSVALLVFF